MVRGRSTRADRDPDPDRQSRIEEKIARARQTEQQALADPSVEWSATLAAPTSAVRGDSLQPVTVEVTAPAVLAGQNVKVGVEPRGGGQPRWQDSTWHGTPAQRRTAGGMLGRNPLRLQPGVYRVVVNIDGVILDAGQVVVT